MRLDRDRGGGEQLWQPANVDPDVHQLADDLSQVRSSECAGAQLHGDEVGAGLVVDQGEDGGGDEHRHSVVAGTRRSASNSSTSDRPVETSNARPRNSSTASRGRSSTRR